MIEFHEKCTKKQCLASLCVSESQVSFGEGEENGKNSSNFLGFPGQISVAFSESVIRLGRQRNRKSGDLETKIWEKFKALKKTILVFCFIGNWRHIITYWVTIEKNFRHWKKLSYFVSCFIGNWRHISKIGDIWRLFSLPRCNVAHVSGSHAPSKHWRCVSLSICSAHSFLKTEMQKVPEMNLKNHQKIKEFAWFQCQL